jgi:hypothetical protein
LKANWTSEETKLMEKLMKFDGTGEGQSKS